MNARVFIAAIIMIAAAVSLRAQMCGAWTVTVDVVDKKGVPVNRSSVAFTDLAEDDIANNRPFKKDEESAGRFFVTFSEGDRVQNEYNLLITAARYQSRTASINISYCHNTSHVIGINPSKPKP
jgi:hypothetical protein